MLVISTLGYKFSTPPQNKLTFGAGSSSNAANQASSFNITSLLGNDEYYAKMDAARHQPEVGTEVLSGGELEKDAIEALSGMMTASRHQSGTSDFSTTRPTSAWAALTEPPIAWRQSHSASVPVPVNYFAQDGVPSGMVASPTTMSRTGTMKEPDGGASLTKKPAKPPRRRKITQPVEETPVYHHQPASPVRGFTAVNTGVAAGSRVAPEVEGAPQSAAKPKRPRHKATTIQEGDKSPTVTNKKRKAKPAATTASRSADNPFANAAEPSVRRAVSTQDIGRDVGVQVHLVTLKPHRKKKEARPTAEPDNNETGIVSSEEEVRRPNVSRRSTNNVIYTSSTDEEELGDAPLPVAKPYHQLDRPAQRDLNQLLGACEKGTISSVKKLLKKNRDLLNQGDEYGFTPLMAAASENRVEIIQFLLQRKGIKPNLRDKEQQYTAAMYPVGDKKNYLETLIALVEYAEVHPGAIDFTTITDKKGKTALDYAIKGAEKFNLDKRKREKSEQIRERMLYTET